MKKSIERSIITLTMLVLCLTGCVSNNNSDAQQTSKENTTSIEEIQMMESITETSESEEELESISESKEESESISEAETESIPEINPEDFGFEPILMPEAVAQFSWYTPYEEYLEQSKTSEDIFEMYHTVLDARAQGVMAGSSVFKDEGTLQWIMQMYNYMLFSNETYGPILIQNKETNEIFIKYGQFDEDLLDKDVEHESGEWKGVWLTDYGVHGVSKDSDDVTEDDSDSADSHTYPSEGIPKLNESEEPYAEGNVNLFLSDGRKLTSSVAGLQLLAINKNEMDCAKAADELEDNIQDLRELYKAISEKVETSHDLIQLSYFQFDDILQYYIEFEFAPILVRSESGNEIFIICGYTPTEGEEQYKNFFDKIWVLSSDNTTVTAYSYPEFFNRFDNSEENYQILFFNNYYYDEEGNIHKDK